MIDRLRRLFSGKPARARAAANAEEELTLRRRVTLDEEITDAAAARVIAQLLYLDDRNPGQPICLVLGSSGGGATQTLAILDAMAELKSPVITWCPARCSGFAALLLAAGRRGSRFAHPEAELILVDPHLVTSDRAPDDPAAALRLLATMDASWELYTGQSLTVLRPYLFDGVRIDPDGARLLGVIDHVVRTAPSGRSPRL